MKENIAVRNFLISLLCLLFTGGVARAQGPNCSALQLVGDSRTVTECSQATGPAISANTRLLMGVGTQGVQCPGCSADVQCYSAQDGTMQYHKVLLFSVHTTVDLHGATFYFQPQFGGGNPYYLKCWITYGGNPYVGPQYGQTQTLIIPTY